MRIPKQTEMKGWERVGFADETGELDTLKQQAVGELNGKEVDGRTIKVEEARPQRPRTPRGSWGGGGGRRY